MGATSSANKDRRPCANRSSDETSPATHDDQVMNKRLSHTINTISTSHLPVCIPSEAHTAARTHATRTGKNQCGLLDKGYWPSQIRTIGESKSPKRAKASGIFSEPSSRAGNRRSWSRGDRRKEKLMTRLPTREEEQEQPRCVRGTSDLSSISAQSQEKTPWVKGSSAESCISGQSGQTQESCATVQCNSEIGSVSTKASVDADLMQELATLRAENDSLRKQNDAMELQRQEEVLQDHANEVLELEAQDQEEGGGKGVWVRGKSAQETQEFIPEEPQVTEVGKTASMGSTASLRPPVNHAGSFRESSFNPASSICASSMVSVWSMRSDCITYEKKKVRRTVWT